VYVYIHLLVYLYEGSCDSSVGIETMLRAGRPGFFSRQGHRVQLGSGVHPVSYPMFSRGYFPGDKAVEEWS